MREDSPNRAGYNEDVKALSSPNLRHLRYEKLRKTLETSILVWPHIYEHKIIGRNADGFKGGIQEFESSFPELKKRASTLSKNGTYLSVTYRLQAADVDQIISLWVASENLQDLVAVM
jgi:putative lipoic acid-binding regulatory protein